MDDGVRGGEVTQEVVDAIAALGNRQRLEILFALAAAAWKHQQQWQTLTFSALHEAIDIESSSQFSYHLDQLVGQFVSETPDGYRLTYSGHRIVRTVLSGLYESTSTFEDRAVDGACVFCEERSLRASLEDEQFLVRCEGCDSVLVTDYFPRSQARGRSPSEVIESFGARTWSAYVLLRGGACPECYGPVETAVESHERRGETRYTHRGACQECLFTVHLPVEVSAVFHPAVADLFRRHGVSVVDIPLWNSSSTSRPVRWRRNVSLTTRQSCAVPSPLKATRIVSESTRH
ncbi:DUF7351 domain-containing protein [Halosimplex sp. J119]